MANYKSLLPKTQNLTLTNLNNSNSILSIGNGGSGGSGGAGQLLLQPQNNPFVFMNDLFVDNKHIKKYEIVETSEDILAISVCYHRKRKDNKGYYIPKLLTPDLFESVTEEDRQHASTIRDYFSKKIMVWKLKNIPLTRFREELNSFIHGDSKKFKEDYCKIAYVLPNFYEYDTYLENLFHDHNRVLPNSTNKYVQEIKKLNYIGKSNRDRKSQKAAEYWYTDENDNIVNLTFSKDNPLLPLLESFNELRIDGVFFRKTHDDVEYYQLTKYKLVKDWVFL